MSNATVHNIEFLPEYRQKLSDYNEAIQQTDNMIYSVLQNVEEYFYKKKKAVEEWCDIIEDALRIAEDELKELYANDESDAYAISLCEDRVNDLVYRRNTMLDLYSGICNLHVKSQSDIEELDSVTRHQSSTLNCIFHQGATFLEQIYIHIQDYKHKKSSR